MARGASSRKQCTLPKAAYQWALRHLEKEGDGDLFPSMFEIDAFRYTWTELHPHLGNLNLVNYAWRGGRRFVVPKRGNSFRSATQLHPFDSLILCAILKKWGPRIEQGRLSESEKRVFSNRFHPTREGLMYESQGSWRLFWKNSIERARHCNFVAIADIADFYNQIYHHSVENELRKARVPEEAVRTLKGFMGTLTSKVSRGLPVGPHASHILAECSLNPIDRSLLSRGVDFARFVDDFHIFCPDRQAAHCAIYELAITLDEHQTLSLQDKKTIVLPSADFIEHGKAMLRQRPLGAPEKILNSILGNHQESLGPLELDQDEADKINRIDEFELQDLLTDCLDGADPDLHRIALLLRGLGQVSSAKALRFCLGNIEHLLPILGDVSKYIARVSPHTDLPAREIGAELLSALRTPLVKKSTYLQILLLDLFSQIPGINHVDQLVQMYATAPPTSRRELVRAIGKSQSDHWIRERKVDLGDETPWVRSALVACAPRLPGDEPMVWIRSIRNSLDLVEQLVARWAFRDKRLKVGPLRTNRLLSAG